MSKEKSKMPSLTLILIIICFLIMMAGYKVPGLILMAVVILFSIFRNRYILNILKGNKAYAAKDFTTTISEYRKAVSFKNVNASFIRGYILIELKYGESQKAKETLDKILSERKFKDHELLALNVSNALITWKTGNLQGAVDKLKEKGVEPALAVIIVGSDPASRVYVNNKKMACERVGMRSLEFAMPEETTTEEEKTKLYPLSGEIGSNAQKRIYKNNSGVSSNTPRFDYYFNEFARKFYPFSGEGEGQFVAVFKNLADGEKSSLYSKKHGKCIVQIGQSENKLVLEFSNSDGGTIHSNGI